VPDYILKARWVKYEQITVEFQAADLQAAWQQVTFLENNRGDGWDFDQVQVMPVDEYSIWHKIKQHEDEIRCLQIELDDSRRGGHNTFELVNDPKAKPRA
jgi:hypothetical protein